MSWQNVARDRDKKKHTKTHTTKNRNWKKKKKKKKDDDDDDDDVCDDASGTGGGGGGATKMMHHNHQRRRRRRRTRMEETIRRCVEHPKGVRPEHDDDEKKEEEKRKRRGRRRRGIEKLIALYALCALNADGDVENAWERVEIVAKDVFQQNDQEFSTTTTRTRELIENQARKKQARLKEKKEQFTEKDWVRWVREEAKKCGALERTTTSRKEDDVKELFFQRYVVTFVTKEKYDARARTSLRRMVSVLNYCKDDDDDDDDDENNNNNNNSSDSNNRHKTRIDWRKDVCKFEAAFAWHVIQGAREQKKREEESNGEGGKFVNVANTQRGTTTSGSWMMSKIRGGGDLGGGGASERSVSMSEDATKNDSTTKNSNSSANASVTSKFGKYLTLGAAAVVGGSLMTLTGGLAAPALIASVGGLAASGSIFAVFGAGTAYVLGVLGTTGVTAIFGATGAGLAAHKMSKRIEQNLEIFRILPLRDSGLLLGRNTMNKKTPTNNDDREEEEEEDDYDTVMSASLNVVLYVPGFLKSGPDELFDAFGSKNGNYYAIIDGDGPLGLRAMKIKPKEDTNNYAEKKDRLKKLAHLGGTECNNEDIDADTLLIVEHDAKTLDDDNGVAKNAGILSGSAILSYHILETNERVVVDRNYSSYRDRMETLKAIERAPRPVRLQLRKIQKLEIDREEVADVALSINENLEEMVEHIEKEENQICESLSSHPSEKPKPPTVTKSNDDAIGANPNWPVQSGEQFVLEWETTELTNLGTAINFFARKTLVNAAAPQAIGHTVFAGVASSVSWPAILLSGASFIDNPWSVLKERAQIAGKELAAILLSREHGRRAVTLIAYSTGTCVVLECLKELDRMIEEGTCLEKDALGVVENVVLVSVPVHVGRKDWQKIRRVTSGRVVNCRANNDWVLRFIYRLKSYDVISSLAGVVRQNYEGVEDIKLSGDICYAHGDIPKAMGDILKVVGLETDENTSETLTGRGGESTSSIAMSESDYDSENEADFAAHQETIY